MSRWEEDNGRCEREFYYLGKKCRQVECEVGGEKKTHGIRLSEEWSKELKRSMAIGTSLTKESPKSLLLKNFKKLLDLGI